MRWPTDTSPATTALRTHQPGKLHPDLTAHSGNPVRPPILHVARPAARLAAWPKHGVVAGLRGNDIPLDVPEQLLRFGQRQT